MPKISSSCVANVNVIESVVETLVKSADAITGDAEALVKSKAIATEAS